MSEPAYAIRADQHRPADEAGYAQAVRQLAAQGLKPTDISTVLKIHPAGVRRLLQTNAAAAAHPKERGL